MHERIEELLYKYYSEADKGYSSFKAPSELGRGEGTEAEYYILKIDLCQSTSFTKQKRPQTYLKLAHTFLSTIDHITRDYGADDKQVEYAGDSVLAYFNTSRVEAFNVLKAAYFCRLATLKMKDLDMSFKKYPFKTRIVLHCGNLILANIGPWGDYKLTAIGVPLHRVGHMEKKLVLAMDVQPKNFKDSLIRKKKNI